MDCPYRTWWTWPCRRQYRLATAMTRFGRAMASLWLVCEMTGVTYHAPLSPSTSLCPCPALSRSLPWLRPGFRHPCFFRAPARQAVPPDLVPEMASAPARGRPRVHVGAGNALCVRSTVKTRRRGTRTCSTAPCSTHLHPLTRHPLIQHIQYLVRSQGPKRLNCRMPWPIGQAFLDAFTLSLALPHPMISATRCYIGDGSRYEGKVAQLSLSLSKQDVELVFRRRH